MANLNDVHKDTHYQEGQPIQLIQCIRPTDEERKDPRYIPQLEINPEAKQIIAERFEAPISIIVYVGNMGVGKSKLATMTIAALQQEKPREPLRMFRSGAGSNGVTQGVWMWSEPLRDPNQNEKTAGSILILDCEGLDNVDEKIAVDLNFFCILISTAFVIVLRPVCLHRLQCDYLQHTLNRFEAMKLSHILPHLWLVPLNMPEFSHCIDDTGDDITISKEEWLNEIFSVSDEQHDSNAQNQRLKEQYQYITRMFPKINAMNIDYLPELFKGNSQMLDVYTSLRSEESTKYFQSISAAVKAFLGSGGKQQLSSSGEILFMQPNELVELMTKVIDIMNQEKLSSVNQLSEHDTANQSTTAMEEQTLRRFRSDLLKCATEVICEKQKQLEAQMEQVLRMDEKIRQYHSDLVRTYYDEMICHASSSSEFMDQKQQQHTLASLPLLIQDRMNVIETEMKRYQEPILLVDQMRHFIKENLNQCVSETTKLLAEVIQKVCEIKNSDYYKDQKDEERVPDEICSNESVCDENSVHLTIDDLLKDVYEANEKNHHVPKLFIVLLDSADEWNDEDPWKNKYVLHFICECSSDQIHLSTGLAFPILNPRVFFEVYGNYLKNSMVPLTRHILQRYNPENRDKYQQSLDQIEKLLHTLTINDNEDTNTKNLFTYLTPASTQNSFNNLNRLIDNDGSVRWLCNKHYSKQQQNFLRELEENTIEFRQQLGKLNAFADKITNSIQSLNSGLLYSMSKIDNQGEE